MSKIIPLGDRVIVEAKQNKNQTSSGIVLPDSKEKPNEGVIIAIGDDVKDVKKGDKVLYKKYSPTEVTIDGSEYLILDVEDVLAKLS